MNKILKGKARLFEELANPNRNLGVSRWVNVDEFKDKYVVLVFGNGGSWLRKESKIAKIYNIEIKKYKKKIQYIRLNGYRDIRNTNYGIRIDIKEELSNMACAMTGTTSNIEVDHKNGRKNDLRVLNLRTQIKEDFQPYNDGINKLKRGACLKCIKNKERPNLKHLGYNFSDFIDTNAETCDDCFWYDIKAFRKQLYRFPMTFEQIDKDLGYAKKLANLSALYLRLYMEKIDKEQNDIFRK